MWALIHPVYETDQPTIHDSVTYTPTHKQLYVSNTYTTFVRSNAQAYLPSASNIKAKKMLMVRTMPNSKKAKTRDMDSKTMQALQIYGGNQGLIFSFLLFIINIWKLWITLMRGSP
jgi:DNA-binding Xre family transcriptional regulator